jgi:MscS family membrane protein
MPDLPENIQTYLASGNVWIIKTFAIVFCTLIVSYIAKRLIDKLMDKAHETHNLWDDALVGAAYQPARYFIWLIGLSLAAQIASANSSNELLLLVEPIRKIGIVIIIAWFLVRTAKRVEHNLADPEFSEKPMDETTVRAVGKLLRVSIIITASLVALQSLGYSISGVLAFGGVGGLAVGFAAKDMLANFFGGLMIYMDRPFSVGDWVRSPDQEIEGTVEDIGWRLTRIRTFDKRPLYIPNSAFTHIAVENPSRMTNRRIKETIGVRYDDASKMPAIIEQVTEFLQQHPDIDQKQTLIVNFNAFSASSLDFFIYTFTKTTNWILFHKIKQDVLLSVLKIIEDNEAECAFPTTTMHVPNGVQVEQQA